MFGAWFFSQTSSAQDNSEDPFALPEGETASDAEGPEAGLRLGLTNVSGSFEPNVELDDEVAGLLPLWLDAGYRFADRWFVGAYFQYAVGVTSKTRDRVCPSCVNTWMRYGIKANTRSFARRALTSGSDSRSVVTVTIC